MFSKPGYRAHRPVFTPRNGPPAIDLTPVATTLTTGVVGQIPTLLAAFGGLMVAGAVLNYFWKLKGRTAVK